MVFKAIAYSTLLICWVSSKWRKCLCVHSSTMSVYVFHTHSPMSWLLVQETESQWVLRDIAWEQLGQHALRYENSFS